MTRLLVIRHATTEWNAAGRIQGRADPSLSDAGRRELADKQLPANWSRGDRMAAGLPSPLRGEAESRSDRVRGLTLGNTETPPPHPALSPEGRGRKSQIQSPCTWPEAQCFCSPLRRAVETATLLGLRPTIEPRLIEMDWGAWEGRRLSDLRAELGEDMAANESRGLDFRPLGGESPRDVQRRLLPWLAGLREPTIAVTHKGVFRALYSLAAGWQMTGKPPDKLRDGCAHLFVVAADGSPAIQELNVPLEPRR